MLELRERELREELSEKDINKFVIRYNNLSDDDKLPLRQYDRNMGMFLVRGKENKECKLRKAAYILYLDNKDEEKKKNESKKFLASFENLSLDEWSKAVSKLTDAELDQCMSTILEINELNNIQDIDFEDDNDEKVKELIKVIKETKNDASLNNIIKVYDAVINVLMMDEETNKTSIKLLRKCINGLNILGKESEKRTGIKNNKQRPLTDSKKSVDTKPSSEKTENTSIKEQQVANKLGDGYDFNVSRFIKNDKATVEPVKQKTICNHEIVNTDNINKLIAERVKVNDNLNQTLYNNEIYDMLMDQNIANKLKELGCRQHPKNAVFIQEDVKKYLPENEEAGYRVAFSTPAKNKKKKIVLIFDQNPVKDSNGNTSYNYKVLLVNKAK